MRVNVQTPNFAAKNELLVFVEKRLSKLEQFYDRIVFADVFLKVQKTSEKENKIVEVLLSVPGDDLMVKKEAKTFEEATDDVVKSLERQLKKKEAKAKGIFVIEFFRKSFVEKIIYIHLQSVRNSGLFYGLKIALKRGLKASIAQLARARDL